MQPDAQGRLRLVWKDGFPAWMGRPGTPEFTRAYREMCTFLAEDLKGLVQIWQIANELEIVQFAGPLNMAQACDLVHRGRPRPQGGRPHPASWAPTPAAPPAPTFSTAACSPTRPRWTTAAWISITAPGRRAAPIPGGSACKSCGT